MKGSKINQDKIQQQIDIIYASINKYNNMFNAANHLPEELLIDIKLKLEKEKRNLQIFKDKYSEYFI